MADVSVGAQALSVKFRGIHMFWTLKRRLNVPLNHVVDARMDPAFAASSPGWRQLGAELPGVIVAGRFTSNGERAFWDLRNPTKAVVIELRGERYKRLVLEVGDPETVVEAIHRALPPRRVAPVGSKPHEDDRSMTVTNDTAPAASDTRRSSVADDSSSAQARGLEGRPGLVLPWKVPAVRSSVQGVERGTMRPPGTSPLPA